MTLSQQQRAFTLNVGKLILWSYEHGYELTFGDAYRTPEQAAANAATGKGISRSLHTIRLAVDLNLFINGEYRTRAEDYKPLGEYWITLSPLNRWGGHFSKPDGNHFSSERNGVK